MNYNWNKISGQNNGDIINSLFCFSRCILKCKSENITKEQTLQRNKRKQDTVTLKFRQYIAFTEVSEICMWPEFEVTE